MAVSTSAGRRITAPARVTALPAGGECRAGGEGILAAALAAMLAECTLDPSLAAWAREPRLVGNAGGHQDPMDDVDLREAEEMSRLARGLFTYLYEMLAVLARSRGAGGGAQP